MSSTEAPRRPEWVKSSYSGGDGGQCVEWAPAHAAATGEFPVRDSKVQEGPHLVLSRAGFAGLVALATSYS